MTAGIQIFNTHGTMQIDDKVFTLGLRAKQTVVIPSGASPNVSVDFLNCDVPLFAFRPIGTSSLFSVPQIYAPTGFPNTRTIVLQQIKENYFDGNPTSSMTVEIYHFDRPTGTEGEPVGLRVFDSAGKCTFNSSMLPAIVAGIDFLIPIPGKLYALVFNGNYRHTLVYTDAGIRYDEEYVTAGNITTTGVGYSVEHLVQYTETPGGSGSSEYIGGVSGGIILDVTRH